LFFFLFVLFCFLPPSAPFLSNRKTKETGADEPQISVRIFAAIIIDVVVAVVVVNVVVVVV